MALKFIQYLTLINYTFDDSMDEATIDVLFQISSHYTDK